MIKIVITGPESSGKTTLIKQLAEALDVPYVQEMARSFLANLGRDYNREDLLELAQLQLEEEEDIAELEPRLLICDTDLLTIIIWSLEKYGECDQEILDLYAANVPDQYLICHPEIPWEPDPLRENPMDRDRLFQKHLEHLKGKEFQIIMGNKSERLIDSLAVINRTVAKRKS